MREKLDKAMRIVSDLVAFCHSEGAEEFQIHMRREDDTTILTVSAPVQDLVLESYDDLVQELNLPRQHEIEQNYWELSGELETHGDLTLVGMMIDGAKIEYSDGVLYIHVWRKD